MLQRDANPKRSLDRAAATDEAQDDEYNCCNEQDVNQSMDSKR